MINATVNLRINKDEFLKLMYNYSSLYLKWSEKQKGSICISLMSQKKVEGGHIQI